MKTAAQPYEVWDLKQLCSSKRQRRFLQELVLTEDSQSAFGLPCDDTVAEETCKKKLASHAIMSLSMSRTRCPIDGDARVAAVTPIRCAVS